MIVTKSTKIYFFDVDRTLVFTEAERKSLDLNFSLRSHSFESDNGVKFYAHEGHIQLMRDLKARGHTVICWSAGGWEWAERVVRLLKLDKTVDQIMSKPDGYCDDKSVLEWLPETDRFYIPIGPFVGGKS